LKRKVVQLPDGLFFFLKIQFLENHDHTFLILHPHQHHEFGFPIAVIRLPMIRFAIRGLYQGTSSFVPRKPDLYQGTTLVVPIEE